MMSIKRVELVIEAAEKSTVIATLNEVNINDYTIYKHVGGNGQRGEKGDLALGEKLENIAFVIACPENQLYALVGVLRPLLKSVGGMCLVSDAQWVMH